jgi:hypothetical protein
MLFGSDEHIRRLACSNVTVHSTFEKLCGERLASSLDVLSVAKACLHNLMQEVREDDVNRRARLQDWYVSLAEDEGLSPSSSEDDEEDSDEDLSHSSGENDEEGWDEHERPTEPCSDNEDVDDGISPVPASTQLHGCIGGAAGSNDELCSDDKGREWHGVQEMDEVENGLRWRAKHLDTATGVATLLGAYRTKELAENAYTMFADCLHTSLLDEQQDSFPTSIESSASAQQAKRLSDKQSSAEGNAALCASQIEVKMASGQHLGSKAVIRSVAGSTCRLVAGDQVQIHHKCILSPSTHASCLTA